MKWPFASSKSICTPASVTSGWLIEVAVGIVMGFDNAADRARQQFAEVVVQSVVAIVQHGAGNTVYASSRFIGGRTAVVAGGVLAIEPTVRLHFAHAIRAREQVFELIET